MAKLFKTRQAKKRGIAVLAVTMAATLSVGMLSACDTTEDPSDDDDNTTVSATDTQLIKNGNFEFYSDNKLTEKDEKRNLISSPDSWTRSTGSDSNGSAPTSESASGIINTAEWDYISRSGRAFSSVEDMLANWTNESVTAYDRIKAYEDYDVDSNDDFELYSDYTYTVDYDDIKNLKDISNPLTHDSDMEEKSVLMIHNNKVTNDAHGTAQYYTSSTTVTLSAGTAAELSLWVKTADLVHWNDQEATSGCGAYIGVTHTVGGETLDQMQIKNINTEVLNPDGDNNGWVEYKLYVRASTFATSTFKIVLGLGMGSTTDMYQTVNGYAFFDDLTCKVVEASAFETAMADVPDANKCSAISYVDDKRFEASAASTAYALDLYAAFNELELVSGTANDAQASVSVDLTKEIIGNRTESTETYVDASLNNDTTKNYTAVSTVEAMRGVQNTFLTAVLEKDFENYPFDAASPIVMLMSANGAPYTAKVISPEFTVEADETLLVSFFVKTSEMNSFPGATISVMEDGKATSINAFDSTTVATIDVDEDNKDIYDGWVQCFFFVSNDTDSAKTFSLNCSYGPTTLKGTTKASYTDGYAAFANFETYALTEKEAGYASTGDRAVKVALTGTLSATGKFDDVVLNDSDSIKEDIAKPANFIGVQGGDKRVGGTEIDSAFSPAPENVFTGLVNSDEAQKGAYDGDAWKTAICDVAVQKGVLTDALAANWWEEIIGASFQPLAIINKVEAAYGYISYVTGNISSSTTQQISVRVKVSDGAKAYVYLVDATELSEGYTNLMQTDLPDVTYWYDDEGNVCAVDPASDDFDKKTDIAYTLQANGLYKNAKDAADTKVYANLANYNVDADGNLVTEDETIAFYAKDGKFYAYYDEEEDTYSVEVTDLDHSIARYDYTDATAPETCIVVDGTKAGVANKWITVAFNVKSGDEAMKYRLEVWSGSRDGAVTNPANSYVLFDNNTTKDITSDYESLLNEAVDALKENDENVDEDDKLKDAFYYAYTFYDDVNYLRYDGDMDEEEAGNPYASYKQSEKTEAIAYLYHENHEISANGALYQMFLDYSLSNVTVEADEAEDDTTEDDTTDEAPLNGANVWLLAASGALVVALFVVIVSIIVRRLMKNRRAKAFVRNSKKVVVKKEQVEKPAKVEKPKKAKDENDPYNE
ncbi:MAG: hypothetical protein J6C93_05130 [Clostridia bacterium]|nr:hypothetical protein [Clostridia bacterium]